MPATASTPPPPRPSKTLDVAVAIAAVAWFLAARELSARSASGIAQRFDFIAIGFVLKPLFLLFLLVVGFSLLDFFRHRRSSTRDLLGLPARASTREEWSLGAAIGWGTLVLSILPIAMFGSLHIQLWTEGRAFLYALFTLAGVALSTLALEITFRGYGLRRLIEAVGPVGATMTMSLIYGVLFAFGPGASGMGLVVMSLLGLLLSLGWLRTHGLWLSWGLNFAWTASLGLLFGMPVAGSTELSSIFQATAFGRHPLTGGQFGPEAAPFTAVALLLAIIPLVRLTRNYAWNYTHSPIIPAGYPMDVAPPAAHTAMASAPPPPPPLVQILPSTPQQRSVPDPPV